MNESISEISLKGTVIDPNSNLAPDKSLPELNQASFEN